MAMPTSRMSSSLLLARGEYHVAALSHTPELAPLATHIQPSIDELVRHVAARASATRALIPIRVGIRFQERAVEKQLRVLGAGATAVDGKRGGATHAAVFPDGVSTETRPRGQRQVDAAHRVINRLTASSLAEPLRAAHLDALTNATTALEAGLTARKRATDTLGAAIAAELATRDDFVSAYDSNMGAVRQHFPKDPDQQELYFDDATPRRGAADDEDQDVLESL